MLKPDLRRNLAPYGIGPPPPATAMAGQMKELLIQPAGMVTRRAWLTVPPVATACCNSWRCKVRGMRYELAASVARFTGRP